MSIVNKILNEALLKELFDVSETPAFEFKSRMASTVYGYESTFYDDYGNYVQVVFEEDRSGDTYTIAFKINDSYLADDTLPEARTMKNYLNIMSNVVVAIKELIEVKDPNYICFCAIDKKARMYDYCIKKFGSEWRKFKAAGNVWMQRLR